MPKFIIEEKAIRTNEYVKFAMMGPSGSGKTYSSLVLASGMADAISKMKGRKAKILLADTEKGRGKYYADEFNFSYTRFDPPYNPENFVELINFAVAQKYDILIIDSSSHEWEGQGGCLELQQQAGGTFGAWKKITPRHLAFIEAITESPIHSIATMRGKDQYEQEKDEKGKITVTKLGAGVRQRDGFEYEFTCTMMLDQKMHTCDVKKDTTHIFDNRTAFIITRKDGEDLIKWANSGYGAPENNFDPNKDTSVPAKEPDLKEIKEEIIKLCVEKGGTANQELMNTLKSFVPSGNPNAIKSIDTAKKLVETLRKM
jgi:hypothetical protein